MLETGIGGVKSPKIRGGVKNLNFQGPWNWPLSTEILLKIVNLGVKSPSLRGATFGASSPPPLAFGTFWPPLSRSLRVGVLEKFNGSPGKITQNLSEKSERNWPMALVHFFHGLSTLALISRNKGPKKLCEKSTGASKTLVPQTIQNKSRECGGAIEWLGLRTLNAFSAPIKEIDAFLLS